MYKKLKKNLISLMEELAKKIIKEFTSKNNIKYKTEKQLSSSYPKYIFIDNSIEIDLKFIQFFYENMNFTVDNYISITIALNLVEFCFYSQRTSFTFLHEKLFNCFIKDIKSYNYFMDELYKLIQINKEKIDLWGIEPKYNKFNIDDKILYGNILKSFLIENELFKEESFYKHYKNSNSSINDFMMLPLNKDLFKKFDIIYNISGSILANKKYLAFFYINNSKLLFNMINGVEIHICSPQEKIQLYISYIKEIKNLNENIKFYFYVNILNKEVCELFKEDNFNIIFSDNNSKFILQNNNKELWFLNNNERDDIHIYLDKYFNILKENNINIQIIKFGFLSKYNGYLVKINENLYNLEFYKKIKGMKTLISFEDFNDNIIKNNFDILIKGENISLSNTIFKLENENLSNVFEKYINKYQQSVNKTIFYLGKYEYLFYLIENGFNRILNIIYLKKDLNKENDIKLKNYIKKDFYEFPCDELYIVNNFSENNFNLFKETIICKKRNYNRLLPLLLVLKNKMHDLYKKPILINLSKFLSQKLIVKIEN